MTDLGRELIEKRTGKRWTVVDSIYQLASGVRFSNSTEPVREVGEWLLMNEAGERLIQVGPAELREQFSLPAAGQG